MLWIHVIAWILYAGEYHVISPDSYAPRTRTALSHGFRLDVTRGPVECLWWALYLLAPSFHHNGLQVMLLQVLLMGMFRCSCDYTRLPSAANLTVCIYIDRLTYWMPYYHVTYLVTVTKKNMIRQNAMWLCKNHCGENTAPSLLQCCTAVSTAVEASCRSAQKSQELQNLTSP